MLSQLARLSPFKRTQIDVLHPKFHCNLRQSRSEMTDPSQRVNVRVLASHGRSANAPPFEPRSTDRTESCEVVFTIFHERQVCDECEVYAKTRQGFNEAP
jgi:hypothetical protein